MNQKTAKALLIALERVRGEPVDLYLRELVKNEEMSLDQLKELLEGQALLSRFKPL